MSMKPELKATYDAMISERDMRVREYTMLIAQAIERLKDASYRAPSTHLGHNLSNNASELSVVAAKIEAAGAAIRFMEAASADLNSVDVDGFVEAYGTYRVRRNDGRDVTVTIPESEK